MKMNLPNKLTLLRVALVPVFMVFAAFVHTDFGYGQTGFSPLMYALAGAVFALASLTDFLDGYLARKNNLVTDFGKFADPLADKMLTTAALIYMVVDGVCSPVVLAAVLFREFAVGQGQDGGPDANHPILLLCGSSSWSHGHWPGPAHYPGAVLDSGCANDPFGCNLYQG